MSNRKFIREEDGSLTPWEPYDPDKRPRTLVRKLYDVIASLWQGMKRDAATVAGVMTLLLMLMVIISETA